MIRRTAAAAGLALLALYATPAASAAPAISQYPLPAGAGAPLGITAGGEGDLWLALDGGGKSLERVTLNGAFTGFPIKGKASPFAIIAGGEGDLWFTSLGGDEVLGALDPATGAIRELPLANNSNASGIARGPEGEIWFLLQGGASAALARVDPLTEQVQPFQIPTANSKPSSLTFGPEGDIYFTETNNPGGIGRFDPATGAFGLFSAITPNSRPTGIATGPEGDIYFTEDTQPGAIGRLVPASGEIQQFSSGITGGAPTQIAAGSNGDMYFTEASKPGAIGQITPAGTIAQYTQGMTLDGEPWAITSGPDGNIWFTEQGNPADVARLTIAPSVSSEAAAATSIGATLSASVGANAQETSYYFEYGTTSVSGSRTASTAVGSSSSPVVVSASVSGLAPQTSYRFRVVASNASGVTYGQEASFSTPAAIAQAVLRPQLGRTAAVVPLSGSVLVKLPRTRRFARLASARTVPVGSLVDARHGSLRVLTALNTTGATQAVRVWDGEFTLAQRPSAGGMTRLLLRGARPSCRAATATRSHHHASSGPRLWAEDNHGRYSTYGANSVATVLGTKWESVETCAGTFTYVARGAVKVHDLHTHRAVIVRARHGYLAHA